MLTWKSLTFRPGARFLHCCVCVDLTTTKGCRLLGNSSNRRWFATGRTSTLMDPDTIRSTTRAMELFSLRPGSTAQDVRSRYKQLAARHHPDVPGGSEKEMKRINEAYETLKKNLTAVNQCSATAGQTVRSTSSRNSDPSQEWGHPSYDREPMGGSSPFFWPEHGMGLSEEDFFHVQHPAYSSFATSAFVGNDWTGAGDGEWSSRGFFYESDFPPGWGSAGRVVPGGRMSAFDPFDPDDEFSAHYLTPEELEAYLATASVERTRRRRHPAPRNDSSRSNSDRAATTSTRHWTQSETRAFQNMFNQEGRSFKFIAKKLNRSISDILQHYNSDVARRSREEVQRRNTNPRRKPSQHSGPSRGTDPTMSSFGKEDRTPDFECQEKGFSRRSGVSIRNARMAPHIEPESPHLFYDYADDENDEEMDSDDELEEDDDFQKFESHGKNKNPREGRGATLYHSKDSTQQREPSQHHNNAHRPTASTSSSRERNQYNTYNAQSARHHHTRRGVAQPSPSQGTFAKSQSVSGRPSSRRRTSFQNHSTRYPPSDWK